MRRFMLPLAAGLALCAGLASADPSDRVMGITTGQYAHSQSRENVGWTGGGVNAFGQARAQNGGVVFGKTRAQGSRAHVTQTGRNNSATINQRGNNKTATVVQRGNDTEVIINQHGEGPGGAWVVTW
ncbi:MAG: curlin repeat-containing protein [Roseovarius sp.]|uniref:curlin repeat-containing protein n=1 Tax=Roseovarius sp. TaxID=1486281 RepID=UPI0032EE0AF4